MNLYRREIPELPSTFVPMTQRVSDAINRQTLRSVNNPLLDAGQVQLQNMISGNIPINPYLEPSLNRANERTERIFNNAVNNIRSNASSVGRYGSNAMNSQIDESERILANALANENAERFFQSAENERVRQFNALSSIPNFTQQDYYDINKELEAARALENYNVQQAADELQRFQYSQTEPERRLSQYAQLIGSVPMGQINTAFDEGIMPEEISSPFTNRVQGLL